MGHTVFQDSVQGALVEARSRGARKLGHSFSTVENVKTVMVRRRVLRIIGLCGYRA